MAASGIGKYIPLEALNTGAENNNNEVEEGQPNHKRSNIWHRIDTASVLTIFLGFSLLLLAVTLLALFWHESLKAIDGAEPDSYWLRIVNVGWATRLVTVCTTSIRTVVALQAGLVTAMVAGIVLETTGVPLLQSPFYSMLRAVKAAPSKLWTATNFQPHLSRFIRALVLAEVLVAAASQLLSTIFLSDFADGTFTQHSNSTKVNVLNTVLSSTGVWWFTPPATSWAFAELSESFEDRSGFHDTGHTFRAFLPFEEEAQRIKLRRLRGPVPVMDHRVVCAAPPLINLTLDASLETYAHLSGQISTEDLSYPLLIDMDSQPNIDFTCRLPAPGLWSNNTVGETSLCVPSSGLNWTVLNEDPLIKPDGYPVASTLFMVLDVLSTAALISTQNNTAAQTVRADGPWTIVSNGSVETLRISACLTNLAMQTLTAGMNNTSDNLEPGLPWDHHTESYNTEPSRLQLGVLSPEINNNTSFTDRRGILTLDPRSQWETFHPPAETLGADPTPFFMIIIPSYPISISSINYTFNSGVILSRQAKSYVLGNAYPTHVDLFQDTLNTTASPALAVQAVLTRISQMVYYEELVKLNSPVTAVTAFSLAATIPVQWTGFVLGMVLILIHSVIVVVVVVLFVRSTKTSFIGSYWQTVAQVVSKETQPILEEADRIDDRAVKGWAKREAVEPLGGRWALRESASGKVTLRLVRIDN